MLISSLKKHILVDRPFAVQHYNASRGGTYMTDQNISCYQTAIRTGKWWWPILSWMVDVTVQNARLICSSEHRDMSELDFQEWIGRTNLKQVEPRRWSGRPKVSSFNVLPDVGFDKMRHYIIPLERLARKCAKEGCKSRPYQGYVKCGVGLCIKCMLCMPYHEEQAEARNRWVFQLTG